MLAARVFWRLVARLTQRARANRLKLALGTAVILTLPVLALWRGFGLDASDVDQSAVEMTVERLDQGASRINVVLKEKSGQRRLVLAVGPLEAYSIVNDADLGLRVDQNPKAYALSHQIASALGGRIQRVVVSGIDDRSLSAKVILATDGREATVDTTAGDAIALALRAKAPIFAERAVLDRAGTVPGR